MAGGWLGAGGGATLALGCGPVLELMLRRLLYELWGEGREPNCMDSGDCAGRAGIWVLELLGDLTGGRSDWDSGRLAASKGERRTLGLSSSTGSSSSSASSK